MSSLRSRGHQLSGLIKDKRQRVHPATIFVRMAQGGSAKASDFVQIPISIVFGIVLGAAAGYVLARVFEIRLPQSNWL